jgi:hypothetical protein
MLLWDGTKGEGVELTVIGNTVLQEAYIGCSIAVNGVCLTATSLNGNKFTVGLASETLRRSNLGKLSKGSKVNLERALKTLKSKVIKTKQQKKLFEKKEFVKPSVRKRTQKLKAIYSEKMRRG